MKTRYAIAPAIILLALQIISLMMGSMEYTRVFLGIIFVYTATANILFNDGDGW